MPQAKVPIQATIVQFTSVRFMSPLASLFAESRVAAQGVGAEKGLQNVGQPANYVKVNWRSGRISHSTPLPPNGRWADTTVAAETSDAAFFGLIGRFLSEYGLLFTHGNTCWRMNSVPATSRCIMSASHDIPCPHCGEAVPRNCVRCRNCSGFLQIETEKFYEELLARPRPVIHSPPKQQINSAFAECNSD